MTARALVRRSVVALFVAMLATVLAMGALTAAWLAGIRVPLASGTTYMQIEKIASADAAGSPDGVFFIALIGNDYRPEVGGARGDALHLAAVNPTTNVATVLNVPRDTCWRGGKINRAHATDGPRGQANALGELIGVPVSYVVSVDFAGFQGIVDGMGGVQMDVPVAMDDKDSGAVFSVGPHRMTGFQALAFSRDRHDFPRGDISRSDNQGLMILAGLRQLQTEAKGAAGEFTLLALLGRHAQLDGMGLTDVYRLGRIAHALDPAVVRSVTIPVGGGGCLGLTGDAGGLFADFADDGTLQTH
ncbi:MAG: LCP family protein [Actinomycetota bacterium]